jgi:hypothetical protein
MIRSLWSRLFRPALIVAMALAFLWSPAAASELFILHALGAEITVGTGAAVDLGNWRNATVHARVTAGSGTVNPFDLWLECSANGASWTECALDDRVEATTTGAGPFTDNTIKLIAEVAVTTAGVYSARLTAVPQSIRARWNIAGTTPSETFELVVVGR